MKALEELFSCYYQDIYRYLYSLCHDASLSEDLTSEVYLEVIKSIGGFREECDVKTWLFSIARRRWFHYLHKKKRQIETAALAEFEELTDKNAEEGYYIRELAQRIYDILDDEQERVKTAVKMRLEGYSFYEIGNALGISESSARVIYFRAKEKIRKQLKEEGFSYE